MVYDKVVQFVCTRLTCGFDLDFKVEWATESHTGIILSLYVPSTYSATVYDVA